MISLAGEWRLHLGCEEAAPFEAPFENTIQIPGILQAQGYGEDITLETPWASGLHDPLWYLREEYKKGQGDGVYVPFLSQPPKHYLGAAWYQREFEAEEGSYEFEIECARWRTEVYLDGKSVGSITSLCAPRRFFLGKISGGKHILTVKADNRMKYPYRPDGHGVSDALGATWNGMVGKVVLERIPEISVQDIVLKPEIEGRTVRAELTFCNRTGREAQAELILAVADQKSGRRKQTVQTIRLCAKEQRESFVLDCSDISGLWDEYDPAVQLFTVKIVFGKEEQRKELPFGFRHIEAGEDGFFINRRPVYLRGTHFGGDFPLTGCPSVEEKDWERIFRICKEWGLNFVRFHSYCPPEAAFAAADRVGIYLQVECAMWEVFEKGNGMAEVLAGETERILRSFGHHPSFLLFSPSNEPGGDWGEVLAEWYRRCKASEGAYSGQRLYTRQSGWPYPAIPSEIDDTDYVYFHRSGYGPFVGGTIRNSAGWAGGDYRASLEGIRYPVITHELGQWCSYPDFSVMEKFTGYMRPGNYKVFKENAAAARVLSQNKEFVRASGRLQVQMYKEDLEANFRTPHIYGYELLDLHDYLGQGSALVGVLDAFWDRKGYVEPEEFKQFCNETVLLLRIKKRIFTEGETLSCQAELSHFGREELKKARVAWTLADSAGRTVRAGSFDARDYALAKNQAIGRLEFSMKGLAAPECYTIRLAIEDAKITNSWNIWLYQQETELPALRRAVYTRELTEALRVLDMGGRVVYCPYLSLLDWNCPYLSEKPVFWNAQMGPKWSRGMGLLCDASHPALRYFPTREYQEYQWNEIIRDAKGVNLRDYPSDFRPIVQPIDEWNRSYKLGLVLEAKVGEGSLLLISSDLERNQESSPAKRQLLKSLLLYADSEEFAPKQAVGREAFLKSFADTQVMRRLGVSGKLLEFPQIDMSDALDGNPDTSFSLEGAGHPYTIELSWKTAEAATGLVYMPVQNQREHKGDVREYQVLSFDGSTWETVAEGELESSFEPKTILFNKETVTNRLRFIAKSGFGGEKVRRYDWNEKGWFAQEGSYQDRGISIAELALITKQGVFAAEAAEERRTGSKTATIEIEE